ncbi:hypothetical protein A9W99_19625 [Mycobacterium sp. 1164966.3]|uniref:DUF302 domain-containing protein n=1 Tax=Mycobacterium sp. 1164966.3 TaxID=1856861 RepID=UPI0007FD2EE9|nr:DUF302 domain-containing protein [Mycobacterium sp. 1164966.3]OBA80271.1 hypothetical protein A9W99_19625 [Mycobacterium sp. 1164966.3]
MSTSEPHETVFTGARLRYESAKSYEELVSALLSDIGEHPVPINEIAESTDNWQSYQERVESHAGASGFMLFGVIDHGAWITKAGIDRKAMRVILGNPLLAITMLRHDVTAGLFAPVELLILEERTGSSLTYVKPSSLMVIEQNPALLSAAERLDAKLAALATKITSGISQRPG